LISFLVQHVIMFSETSVGLYYDHTVANLPLWGRLALLYRKGCPIVMRVLSYFDPISHN
jgi:hypothetical protein